MTHPLNSSSSATPTPPHASVEKQSPPEATGRTENMHQVKIEFDDGSKEKTSNLFESTKDSISSFFSTLSSHLNASAKHPASESESFLSKISKILARIFSFFTQIGSEAGNRVESSSGKTAVRESLQGKEISQKKVSVKKGDESIQVNNQFYLDLSRSNISWNGQLLMKREERTHPALQFDSCKKMESELGGQGFENISTLMNQATLADALIYLSNKFADEEHTIAGLSHYDEHRLEYQVDTHDENQVKLTILVDFALVENDKIENLFSGEGIKAINPQFIAYKREIIIPRSELNTDWKARMGEEAAPGLKVVDQFSKPSYSFEEAKKAVT